MSVWAITWKYEWNYSLKTDIFKIVKRYMLWNGKKHKPIRGSKNEIVFQSHPPFKVNAIIRKIEKTQYDFGAWCVSESEWVETRFIEDFDRTELASYFKEIVKQLPIEPK